ncbi:hypothetical protein K488DRAFT_70005 [Vararia minispora EC-137]|uniref:Uncharacterized protein n=1 Tax=Vararia minispora EC-137 TaxID=1314806 RepID=A0ACB8QNM0_9AGAM|nr:hypothetical protein K488DRAFT_70005 [Vararia minispora EC-137]
MTSGSSGSRVGATRGFSRERAIGSSSRPSSSSSTSIDLHRRPLFTHRSRKMSLWSTMQSVAGTIIGWIGAGVGSVWDEEMGRVEQPEQNGTTTDDGNAVQNGEGGDVEGGRTQQEDATVGGEVSDNANGVSPVTVEQPTTTGNGGLEANDNNLRLRAWGRGCGGCGLSMPATRDGRRALLILGVILIVLGCIVLGITAEVNRMSGGNRNNVDELQNSVTEDRIDGSDGMVDNGFRKCEWLEPEACSRMQPWKEVEAEDAKTLIWRAFSLFRGVSRSARSHETNRAKYGMQTRSKAEDVVHSVRIATIHVLSKRTALMKPEMNQLQTKLQKGDPRVKTLSTACHFRRENFVRIKDNSANPGAVRVYMTTVEVMSVHERDDEAKLRRVCNGRWPGEGVLPVIAREEDAYADGGEEKTEWAHTVVDVRFDHGYIFDERREGRGCGFGTAVVAAAAGTIAPALHTNPKGQLVVYVPLVGQVQLGRGGYIVSAWRASSGHAEALWCLIVIREVDGVKRMGRLGVDHNGQYGLSGAQTSKKKVSNALRTPHQLSKPYGSKLSINHVAETVLNTSAGPSAQASRTAPPPDCQQQGMPTSLPSSSSVSPTTSSSKPSTTSTRFECCRPMLEYMAKRGYPDITPRNDYEMSHLSCGNYKPQEHGDFYTWVERQLLIDAQLFCPEDIERGKEIALSRSTKLFEKPARISGFKPMPGDNEDVHICPIPNSEFSIRLFGKYMEDKRQYGLDFVRTSTGKSENSPFQYDLFTVPDPDVQTAGPMMGPRSGRLFSVESGLGLEPSEIHPGAEKFILSEGMCCLLKRKGQMFTSRSLFESDRKHPSSLKLENLQPERSFKNRGISHFTRRKLDEHGAGLHIICQVICPLSGHGGRAATAASKALGVKCTICLPEGVNARTTKHFLLFWLYARILFPYSRSLRRPQRICNPPMMTPVPSGIARSRYAPHQIISVLLSTYDDPLVWEGHASIVSEIKRDFARDLDAILCSVGRRVTRQDYAPIIAMETHGSNYFFESMAANMGRKYAIPENLTTRSDEVYGVQIARLNRLTSHATSLGASEAAAGNVMMALEKEAMPVC